MVLDLIMVLVYAFVNDVLSEAAMSMNPQRREVFEQQILRCLLAKMYIKDIGSVVGLDQSTVRKYIRGEAFREMLRVKYPEVYANVDADLQVQADTVSQILEENSRKALERLAELIDSDNEHISLKASQDAMDRYTETAKIAKSETKAEVKLDPIFLIHAAGVAQEMDSFVAPPQKDKKELTN